MLNEALAVFDLKAIRYGTQDMASARQNPTYDTFTPSVVMVCVPIVWALSCDDLVVLGCCLFAARP